MPRDGSNVYRRPPGTDAISNTTISSTAYNGNVADVEQDLNTPRPIIAGGTGATTAAAALVALSGEQAKQVISNFDSAVWAAGSFYAAATATGSPIAGHAFAGIAYYANATDFVVEALDLTDAAHQTYARIMSGGVWGSFVVTANNVYSSDTPPAVASDNSLWWESDTGTLYIRYNDGDSTQWVVAVAVPAPDLSGLVAKTGDTMTGSLILNADPVNVLGAVTKQYSDTKVLKTGDTMTGPLVLPGVPTLALQAASKSYVDSRVVVLRSYLAGLTLSTAGSLSFGVVAGAAADNTNVDMLALNAAITKTTATWAVGTGNGALDTGVIAASTWYHAYLIKRPDTGVVDVLISLSATAPTLPASYTLFRRIGAMKTNASSQWTLFHQLGDEFLWDAPFGDVNSFVLGTTSTLFSLSVPSGLQVTALFRSLYINSTASAYMLISSPDESVQAANTPPGNLNSVLVVAASGGGAQYSVRTSINGQIRAVGSVAAGSFFVATNGWIDRRGRDN